jgi:hypothetical protein
VQELRAQAAAQDGKTLGHQVLAQRAEQLVVAAAGRGVAVGRSPAPT